MKKYCFVRISMTLCLICGIFLLPFNQLKAHADEIMATVEGKILSGTTSELLKLSTKEGKMEIKLDSGTDTSGCKILLPDKKVYVSVSHGADGYLHAVRITTDTPVVSETLDESTLVTVSGTLGEKTNDAVLYLDTAQGEMQIKLDVTTSLNECAVLVMGKTYYVTCARGGDAYMHAVSISDTSSSSSPAAVHSDLATASVTGTVADKTKEDLLYLSTKEGEMQFKIDSDADTSRGMVLTPGNKLTVSFYRGSDAYLHAAGIAGEKDSAAAPQIDESSYVTVTGTVGSSSDQNLLYLYTPQGKMELKLDAVSSLNNCKVLVSGKKLNVTCGYGTDAYMHAITITGA